MTPKERAEKSAAALWSPDRASKWMFSRDILGQSLQKSWSFAVAIINCLRLGPPLLILE